jgi:hypothetical protein
MSYKRKDPVQCSCPTNVTQIYLFPVIAKSFFLHIFGSVAYLKDTVFTFHHDEMPIALPLDGFRSRQSL